MTTACLCGEEIRTEAAARRHAKVCGLQGYPQTLDGFNADNRRAHDAYEDDKTVADGYCPQCGHPHGGWTRICPACRQRNRRSKT